MELIVSKKWLLARMYEPDVVIVDCRFDLSDPDAGRRSFEESHIPGAVFLDIEQDLSAPVSEHGGRHPLPDPEELAARFRKAGISNESRVIAYDDQGGMYAARLWWLLRWLGHDNAAVLDEGFSAWKNGGYPVTSDTRIIVPASFVPDIRPSMVAAMQDVRQSLGSGRVLLVDSRDESRYAGEHEPLDKKAGHIPGAMNRFWKQLFQSGSGAWKAESELRSQLEPVTEALSQKREVIVYCGSGISAAPNVLALHLLGYPQVKLYSGSWSDWISYDENPVAVGRE
ncbi:sulfurtransferase [Paenibacillus pinistramenti]|uniref:sulfurtransferase n=1 Tax=Paenibacillus pinistramenti TaxID=1768003 RepID=UPI0011097D4E|nr:sulfurtransferase [Paenibacillus pinistramenti]